MEIKIEDSTYKVAVSLSFVQLVTIKIALLERYGIQQIESTPSLTEMYSKIVCASEDVINAIPD